MPIDPFRTQVLLLHSEQSALDELGSRFNDRYTVHFATSGSQALSTLAETPINIIISAQDLPGMSGLEALREAKKRSPDTVGILITGDDEDGSEAFVGEEEVFHIVRGSLTADSLIQLVDSATKKTRLMTLSESANDARALADDSGEHMVMETADNGLPVATSATGRMPALDPAKFASVRPVDVLVLTGDEKFLQTVQASSRGMHTVHSASTLNEANTVMRQEEIGVVVIDAAMINDKVEHLTQALRKEAPRLVAVVAGRRDDGDMLVDLINRGKVYRFMMKPVTPGRARLAVEAAVKHHLEAPDSAFKGAEDTSADVNVADAQQTKEAALEISEPAVSDAFGSEQVDEAPATVDEQAPSHTETAPAEDTETAAVPDVGTGSLRATQSIKTSERMQKLAAARLESRAATSAHFPKLIAIGAAAIVIVAGAWLWLSGGDVEETTPVETIATPPSVAESDVVIDDPVDEVPAIDMDALLASPRAARQAGAIFEPAESNAIDLYQAAVLESEGDPLAVAEFDAVISEALTFAETALIESRLDDAELALQRIADVDADNVRLPFLSAQLQQARMFEILSEARAAIRDSRLQDAAGFLETAEALSVTDRTEIDAVASELDLARKAQRTDEVLALADARLEAGDLLVPANRNARHYYELVLSNDSHNKAARQGLKVIAGRLVLEARTSIDNGDFANAEMLLGEVEILDPQNGQLLATAEALRASRESAEAERAAAELRAQSELETSDDLPTEATLQATPAVATVPVDEGTSSDAGSFNAEPVAVSSLIRTRYVAPKYPRSAQRRNLSGWVDISFTVDVDGTVKDVAVRESEPGTTFDDAAMRAVEKWEFEPVLYDGAAIEQRVAVRMMFALE